ncbi:MAG: hypothetical protein IMX01_02865 [Limnochordaceae bacterium]|nr:hypothetical protein [Limnochordaceae bacterium]
MPTPHPIESLLATAMESIKSMVDVNTILGDPVETADGTVILPVSRVSFGFAAGGKEFGRPNEVQVDEMMPSPRTGQGQANPPLPDQAQANADPYAANPVQAPNAAVQGQGQVQGQGANQGQGQARGRLRGQGGTQGQTAAGPALAYSGNRVTSYPFGGGSGAGVSLFPVAFLVVKKDEVRLMTVDQRQAFYDRLIDLVPKLLDWIRPATVASPASENLRAEAVTPTPLNHSTY